DRETERAGTAAHVDDHDRGADLPGHGPGRPRADRAPPRERDRLVHEQDRALARDEHSGVDADPQAVEVDVPEHVLERLALDAASDERLEVVRVVGPLDQERGLLLGEDAPGGAQPRGEVVELLRVHARTVPLAAGVAVTHLTSGGLARADRLDPARFAPLD